jgi:hypothetical protein
MQVFKEADGARDEGHPLEGKDAAFIEPDDRDLKNIASEDVGGNEEKKDRQ